VLSAGPTPHTPAGEWTFSIRAGGGTLKSWTWQEFRALPAETVDGWAGLGAAPIVNLHVRYDRKVMDVPFAAAVDSPVQWVFDRTRISGMHARGDDGQYLAVSLSAADPYVNMSVAELREMFVPALAALFPEARAATVTEFFVTRERRATFRQVPGTAKLRPKSATAPPTRAAMAMASTKPRMRGHFTVVNGFMRFPSIKLCVGPLIKRILRCGNLEE